MSEPNNSKWDSGEAVPAADLIELQSGGVVSRTIVKKKAGTVTVFAFDADEGLSEHTTPFEALLMSLVGDADITISGIPHRVGKGDMIRLPANEPHAVKAVSPFTMLLIMIRE
ncbi:MAG: cupin domain-containing protein [Pyrinomonadaceae bacterium]|nr:cupin domain-containing protein [Pyrinomonadaceae bacterium]